MGLLKKITKPISKILDKIIPNEIKPALPFLSAAAPFMLGPGIMGTSMLQRALMSGGINLASQLAQEGSEGEFSGLSALLAAGTGAMTAPGTPGTAVGPAGKYGTVGYEPSAQQFFEGKAAGMDPGWMKSGTEMLGKGAEYLTGAAETLQTAPFSKAGLKAAIVPVSHGMGDLAMADARRALKDYERQLEETGDIGSDENRALAIRLAMEAGGHSEETIVETIKSLGYKQGGRVNKEGGGILEIEFKEMANGGMTDSVLPRGTEMDYRGGGMIPMGSKERADDVPARLSKNEFVMTADAVRAAGGGSVNEGARRMYNLMHNLEARA